jgi:predicted oxidoreductase
MSKAYSSNLTQDQWELLEVLISPAKPGGRPREVEIWEVLNAIFYLLCEGCLQRLKLDRIDLYQLHRPDPNVPFTESIGMLAELQQEGKIRHIGLSNVPIAQIEQARKLNSLLKDKNESKTSK